MTEEVKLILTLEDQKFLQGAARSLRATEKNTNALKGWKGTAISVNAALGILKVGLGVAASAFNSMRDGVLEATRAASDFVEENNKFAVVFKGVEKDADAMRKTLVDGYNLSKKEATQLLAATGDLLTGFGFQKKAALDLSGQVQTLASDLASFNNLQGGTKRASEIVTKALLGETESLKSLGVSITQAQVQQELAARGQEKLTGQALLAAKAQATYSLIVKQSGNAIGDTARNQDEYATLVRQSTATIEDLKTEIGAALLPAMTQLQKSFVSISKQVLSFTEANKEAISNAFVIGLQIAIKGVSFLAQGIGGLAVAFYAGRVAFSTVMKAIIDGISFLLEAFITLKNNVISVFKTVAQVAVNAVSIIVDAIAEVAGYLDEDLALSARNASKALQNMAKDFGKEGESAKGIIEEWNEELKFLSIGTAAVRDEAVDDMIDVAQASQDAKNTIEGMIDQLEKARGKTVKTTIEVETKVAGEEGSSGDEVAQQEEIVAQKIALTQQEIEERKKLFMQFYNDQVRTEEEKIQEQFENRMAGLNQMTEAELTNLGEREDLKREILAQKDEELAELEAEQREVRAELRREEFDAALEDAHAFTRAAVDAFEVTGNAASDIAKTTNKFLVKSFANAENAAVKMAQSAVRGTLDSKKAMKDLASAILDDMIGALVRMGAQYIINSVMGAQSARSNIQSAGATAFANGVASWAAAPWPVNLGAPAFGAAMQAVALAANASVGSRQFGDDNISQTGEYRLHAGERVVPTQTNADLSQFLRDQLNNSQSDSNATNINVIIEGDYIGEEKFADEMAAKVIDAIELRNIDTRDTF